MKLVFSIFALCFLLSGAHAQVTSTQPLPGHIPAAAKHLNAAGHLEKERQLKLSIGLQLRNREALTNLLQRIYTPSDPLYHHYLTPQQFADAFGPTTNDYEAVEAFARARGFAITATHKNRMLLDVAGSVANIEKTFHVGLRTYPHPNENRTFYAPDAEPTVELATPILHVGGLDNYVQPRPFLRTKQLQTALATVAPGTGSGPGGTYSGNDFRAAYVPGTGLTGAGQSVGLVEFDGYNASDVTTYMSMTGEPSPPLINVFLDGVDGSAGFHNSEVALDIEMAVCMAPGLKSIVVYEGETGDDILNQMATDDSASTLSSSWSYPIDDVTEQIFLQFAAQGQTMVNASGDNDAWPGDIAPPCDDPNITSVGGTTLTTAGPGGAWVAETVWNWGLEYGAFYDGEGSGGGISHAYTIPSWQAGMNMMTNLGSRTLRNIPDVAMTADNIFEVADGGQLETVGGTSCAAALFAGFVALANEEAMERGRGPVGFLNRAIYAIGGGVNYTNSFHDITTGNNTWSQSPNVYLATPGYDLCSGWGTPAGTNLIDSLASDSLQVLPGAGLAFAGRVGGPFLPAAQSYVVTNAGIASFGWAAGCNAPWVSLTPTGGTLTAGGSNALVNVSIDQAAANLPLGTYEATVWFTNLTDGIVQSNFVSLGVIPPPVISNQPVSLTQYGGTTATFGATVSGGLPLSFQWRFNGNNLVNTRRIQGAASVVTNLVDGYAASDLVISNIVNADAGSYSLVVSNAAGTAVSSAATLVITHSTPVITQQPTNQTVLFGAKAQMAIGVYGDLPIVYQWEQDGVALTDGPNLSGSEFPALTISNASPANIGGYRIVVRNLLGSTASQTAKLTVDVLDNGQLVSANGAPVIANQPSNQTTAEGGTASFTVVSAGELPLSYQWKFNGGPIAGETNAELALGGASKTDVGTYSVVVSNALGSTASAGAELTVFSGIAELITFDDLASGTTRVPEGYGGLSWSNFYYINAANVPLTGYNAGMVSAPNVAFNQTGAPSAISSLTPFSLLSAYLTSAWNDGLQLEAKGYNASGLAFDNIYPLSATNPTFINFNYIAVTSVEFSASGGAFHPGYKGNGGNYFAMDNVEVSLTTNASSPPPITTVHSFGGRDGGYPVSALAKGMDGNFYGVTQYGGTNGYGTVFEMSANGLLTTLASLDRSNAYPFGGLMQGIDGKLYGTTQFGGTNGDGTVFSITTNGVFTTLASFNLSVTGSDPETTLTQGADGNLYGTTYFGGANGVGCVFMVTTNGAMTGLVSFNFANGAHPLGSLASAPDGNLYGTTAYGGSNGLGTVYRITTNGVLSTIFTFGSSLDGTSPDGTLAYGPDGKFYGVTFDGGTNGAGTIYSITPEGDFFSLASLDYFVTGGNPETGLVLGSDGNFYGTAISGGANIEGAIYSVTTNGTLTALGSFAGTNGATPQIGAALVQGSDGNFYGTAAFGGVAFNGSVDSGDGVIYRLGGAASSAPVIMAQPSDQYALPGGLATFSVRAGGDGPLSYIWFRDGVQILGASTSTYTTNVGANGTGGLFYCVVKNLRGSVVSSNAYLNISGADGPLFAFNGADGGFSYSPLLEGADGKLYGTTFYGGDNGDGTVFCITTNGVLNTLFSFDFYVTGAFPYAELAPAPDGSFYGTTAYGGRDGYGTVFNVTTNGKLTTLFSFNAYNGAYPYGGVVPGNDGSLYGTTYEGGAFQGGIVFRLTTNGALTTLASFNSANGANPFTGLLKAADGNFYGASYYGGVYGLGTIFKVSTGGALTALASFAGNNGANPSCVLTQDAAGNLYGSTSYGGTFNDGTVFKITTNGSLTMLTSLDGTNGSNPRGALVQGPDGSFYGITYAGGPRGNGVAYSITTNGLYTRLFSFEGTNGSGPASLSPGPGGAFFGATTFGAAGFDGQFASGNGTIFRIAPSHFSIGSSQSVTYGTSAVTLAGSVTALGSIHPVAGEPINVTINGITKTTAISDNNGNFSINFNLRGIPVNETGYTITYSYSGNGSLSPATSSTATLTIAPLRVSLTGVRNYDATANALASILVVSNAVGADQVRVVSGSAGLASAGVGSNAIVSLGTLALGGSAAGNYTLSGAGGAVVISPLPLNLAGARLYDGTAVVGASLLSVETNYDGTNIAINGSVILQGAGAGNESIADVSGLVLSGPAAINYTLTGAGGTVTVTPLPLTITLSNASKTYGQKATLKSTAFSVSGTLAGSERVTSVSMVSAGAAASAQVSGSPYPITANGASGSGGFEADNYQIAYNAGSFTVRDLKVVVRGNRSYDGTTNVTASILIVSNAVAGDQVGFASGSGALAEAGVGTNAIISLGTLALGGAAASNYTLSGAGGAVTIHPLPVSLTGTRPYDGTDAVDASLLSIETNYDGTNLSLGGSATLETNLTGAENITDFSGLTINGTAATNYTFAGADGTVLVTPLPLTITLSNASKSYGQSLTLSPTAFALTGTLAGAEAITSVIPTSAGTPTTATVSNSPYSITASGASGAGGFDPGNYEITYAPGLLTVHTRRVVFMGNRNYDATTNVAAPVLVVSNLVDADQVTAVSGSAGLASANAGTNAITSVDTLMLGGAAAGNYTLNGARGSIVIHPLPVTLSGTRPYDGTKEADAAWLSIETNYDGTNLGLSGSATLQGAAAGMEDITDFGDLSLSGSAATNYTLSGASGAILVTPMGLTITLSNASKTYGQTLTLNPGAFGVTSALPGSQSVTAVEMVSAGTAATATVAGSPYPITANGASGAGGFDASNYQITYEAGSLRVGHLRVVLGGSRNYDATTNIDASALIVLNAMGTDEVSVVSGTAGLAWADIGTNAITSFGTLALGGAAADNYKLTNGSGAVVIHPLPLRLDGTRPYDGTELVDASLLSIETNYDGTNLSLSGAAVLGTNAVGSEDIADFSGLVLSGSAATNYTLAGANGSVTITPLAVTLIGARYYDGTTNATASILTVFGAVGADQVTVVSGSGGLAGASIGTNAINSLGTLTLGGPVAGNYSLDGASGAVVINPLPVVLEGTRPYDTTTTVNAAQLSIETNYDGSNLSLSGSATLQGADAGTESIGDFSGLSLSGSAATNYTLEGASGAVQVTPLTLTITLSNASKTYGQTLTLDPTAFVVTGGLLGSQTVTSIVPISAGTATSAPVSGSPYPITVSNALGAGGFEAGNYQIISTPGELTVHHLRAVLGGRRDYNATTNAPAAVLVVSNAVVGDDVDFASGSAGLAGANIGTNAITSVNALALEGAAADNYTLTGAGGAVVIDPLPVNLGGTRPYDGTAEVNASSLTIETNYDGTNLSLSGSAVLQGSGAGAESIADFSGLTLSGSAATNYTLDSASGTVMVTPLALTITLSNASKTYGQVAKLGPMAFQVTGGALLGSEIVTSVVPVSVGTAAAAPLSGSPYAITASGAYGTGGFEDGNYDITYIPGTLTIHHLKVVLGGNRHYDATTNAAAPLLIVSNAVAGDDVGFASGSAGLAGADVGTNAITSMTKLTLGGATAPNYTLSGAGGAVVITPLPVTLSGTRAYDGTMSVDALLLSIETNYDGTNLSLGDGAAVLESSAVGPEGIADFSSLTLSGLAATNYTLVGATGIVTVTNPHAPFAATSVTGAGTNAVVCWQSVPGVFYEFITTTNLSPPLVWEVTGDPILATGTNTCATLPESISTNTFTLMLIREL